MIETRKAIVARHSKSPARLPRLAKTAGPILLNNIRLPERCGRYQR